MHGEFLGLLKRKRGFLAAVFAVLAGQIAITLVVMRSEAANRAASRHPIAIIVSALALVVAIALLPAPPIVKLCLMCALSAVMGAVLSRAAKRAPEGAVRASLLGAAGVLVAMAAVGFALASSGVDLGPMGVWLLAALIGVIVAQVAIAVTRPKGGQRSKWMSTIITVLFALFVMHDANRIVQRNYDGGVAEASLDFYLDFLNLFSAGLSN